MIKVYLFQGLFSKFPNLNDKHLTKYSIELYYSNIAYEHMYYIQHTCPGVSLSRYTFIRTRLHHVLSV